MTFAPQGWVAPGFEPVREAFAENFTQREELGAAFAVTIYGEPVIDLWGGVRDEATGAAWERETLQLVFSNTKLLVGLCLLVLVDRGELDLEAPVCRYWPEFGQNGKQQVTVLDLASHQARLPGFRKQLSEDDFADDVALAALLAAQPAEDDPRAKDIYHPFTYGWLSGEVIRRVSGRSVGRFFAEEIAAPLGLEVWIGLPPELEQRVSTLRYASTWGSDPQWDADTLAQDELLARVWDNPPPFPVDGNPWNRPDWHGAEIPGAGAIATARSLARLMGCLARGGEIDGTRLLSPRTVALGRREVTRRTDPLLNEPHAFGTGFSLQTEQHEFGPPTDAFGYTGAGGSLQCVWPSVGVGVAYVMNVMRDDRPGDPRSQALLRALYQSLERAE